MTYALKCTQCEKMQPNERLHVLCVCGGTLTFHYASTDLDVDQKQHSMWRYRRWLPLRDPKNIVTLGEGLTPLLPARIDVGVDLHLKNETVNPSGSMKDRALSVAFSVAAEFGKGDSIIASGGSAGLSAATYAARAGIQNTVLLPQNAQANRLLPIARLGSRVFKVRTKLQDIYEILQMATAGLGYYEVSTYQKANPYQAEGAKTIAYEIFEQMDAVPDWVVCPVGGGGTLSGIWRGFQDLHQAGRIEKLPKLLAVEAQGFDSLAQAYATGGDWQTIGEHLPYPQKVVEIDLCAKIAHTVPPDGAGAWGAIEASAGAVATVSGEEAFQAQGELARTDGIFIEPTSGVVIPAIRQSVAEGVISEGETVVAILSGGGFREMPIIETYGATELEEVAKDQVVALLEQR